MNNNYNNPQEILTREEFESLPREKQRELMQYWRENYPSKKIRKKLGYHNSTSFYNLLRRLSLPTNLSRIEEIEIDSDGPELLYATKKNLKNEPEILHVELVGDIDLFKLPGLLKVAQESGLLVKIEHIDQPWYGWFFCKKKK